MEQLLKEHYGLTHCTFQKMEGYISTNYRVTCDQGQFVLKVYPATTQEKEQILGETALVAQLDHLEAHAISQPIYNQQGDVFTQKEDQVYRLLSFVEGEFLAEVKHSPELCRSLGRFMAKIDKKLIGFSNHAIEARRLDWDLHNIQQVRPLARFIKIPLRKKLVDHFFLQWDSQVAPHEPALRRSIIHNDANDWNLLVTEGEISGIIDLGDAVHSALIYELAIAITYALFEKEDPIPWACYLVESYHSELPLEPKELDLLYYLIAGRLITSVCKSAHENATKPERDYITISEQPAWNMLERWVTINPLAARNAFYEAAGFTVPEPQPVGELLEKRFKVVSPILSISYQSPIHMTGAAFQYMYDGAGHTFLDAYNNIPHVGHQHPRVVAAGQRQMALLNTNTRYLYDQLEAYASELLDRFPAELDKVYFVNSGSAASDLAVRLAMNYTSQQTMMVMEHGYHGNTRIGIDISHYKYTSRGGMGRPAHIVEAPIPDIYRGAHKGPDAGEKYAQEALELLGETPLAGFIAEPIIGCGGQVPLAPGYLQALYPAIRQKGGLCISDEVQTGFGRMGSHFWGYEMQGVVPDIVVLGKPMGNGHPMGAVVTRSAVAEAFDNGMEFFSSFGGNPVSCEIGRAVLGVIEEEKLQANALQVGNYYMEQLRSLQDEFDCIGDVRGSGLFIGVEFIKEEALLPATELAVLVKNELRNRHILVSTDGPYDSVIKTKPPLCFSKANVDQVVAALRDILKSNT